MRVIKSVSRVEEGDDKNNSSRKSPLAGLIEAIVIVCVNICALQSTQVYSRSCRSLLMTRCGCLWLSGPRFSPFPSCPKNLLWFLLRFIYSRKKEIIIFSTFSLSHVIYSFDYLSRKENLESSANVFCKENHIFEVIIVAKAKKTRGKVHAEIYPQKTLCKERG